MLEDQLFEILDPILKGLGAVAEDGEEFRSPPLDVLRYYRRPVRLGPFPIIGRATGVVAVVRQPMDIGLSTAGYRTLLTRLAMAVNGRFPPWPRGRGLSIGLTAVILTPEPIRPEDDTVLPTAFVGLARMRAVPMGILRLNLGQEAMAHALSAAPDGLFPEAAALADALAARFRRFVPLFEV